MSWVFTLNPPLRDRLSKQTALPVETRNRRNMVQLTPQKSKSLAGGQKKCEDGVICGLICSGGVITGLQGFTGYVDGTFCPPVKVNLPLLAISRQLETLGSFTRPDGSLYLPDKWAQRCAALFISWFAYDSSIQPNTQCAPPSQTSRWIFIKQRVPPSLFLSHSLQSMYSELPTFINALRLLLSVISGMNQNETAEKDTHTHTWADVSNASV